MRKIMIGLAPILFAMSSGAIAADWKISETSGDVRIVSQGKTRAAVRGALLSSGSTIATGANARAVIVRGQEFVMISPRSQLRVPAAEAPNKIMQIIEDFGTAVFKINKKSTPHFGVQTPYLAAVVKGTTFTVTVGPEGGSVQVTEGAVEVSTLDGGAAELVRPGTIAQVGASDLHHLTVQGDVNKVVRSENAPEVGSVNPNSPASSNYNGPASESAQVHARHGEDRNSISDATDGLVEGPSPSELAHADMRDLERGNGSGPPAEPGNGSPPADPGSGNGAPPADPGNGTPPADPGSGSGAPPVDPGNGSGGPPLDPGSGSGNPPVSPGSGSGAPPVDPGSGSGAPPVDPGSGSGNPPVDPGSGSGAPPVDPGNGSGAPPVDPGSGSGAPPVDPGSGAGGPPVDPGSGSGNPPVDPGSGSGIPPVDAGSGPDNSGSDNSGSGSDNSGSGSGSSGSGSNGDVDSSGSF